MIEYRNPKQWPDGRIDCEINHPTHGWIPFSAVDGDTGAAFDVAELRAAMLADPVISPVMTAQQITAREQAARAAGVRAEAALRMSLLAAPYSREERETWPVQIAEAEAFTADAQAAVPMLTAIAAPRGLTVAQMAALVLSLRDGFKAATGAILAAQAALLAMDPIPANYTADEHWP